MCCCKGCRPFYNGAFGIIIWIELISGLVATTATAFLNDKANVWAYVIFVADVVFASLLVYYTGKEICCNKTKDFTLNWICGMCSVVTIALFGALYFLARPPKDIVNGAFVVYVLAVFSLWMVASCYIIYLRLGYADDDSNNSNKPKRFVARENADVEKSGEGKSLEQSLAQMVDNAENNPTKTYRLYAVGSEAPFNVNM